jgi:hypothetical protein
VGAVSRNWLDLVAATALLPGWASAADPPATVSLSRAPRLEIRTLIGESRVAEDYGGPILRLGPKDANWDDVGAPIDLRVLRQPSSSGPAVAGGDDATCLTQAVYYEAGYEPLEGQEAVAQVVLNRARGGRYPSNVCGVVFQRTGQLRTCQFTFACDGAMKRPIQLTAWLRAQAVATKALQGFVFEPAKDATHYHADYVAPNWSFSLRKIGQIGRHVFYQ